jgi:hypothetical protein
MPCFKEKKKIKIKIKMENTNELKKKKKKILRKVKRGKRGENLGKRGIRVLRG